MITTSDTTPAPSPTFHGGPLPYTPAPTPTMTATPLPYTPSPTPTPTSTYTPPVLHCGPYETPGWLDSHGNPTSCTNNCPWWGQTAAECHNPTPAPSPTSIDNGGNTMSGGPEVGATPAPTQSIVSVQTTPSGPELADTGMDVTAGVLLGMVAVVAIVAGVILRRRDARKAAQR